MSTHPFLMDEYPHSSNDVLTAVKDLEARIAAAPMEETEQRAGELEAVLDAYADQVAAVINALDDGTGVSNGTMYFANALVSRIDRKTTWLNSHFLAPHMAGLDAEDLEFAAELIDLRLKLMHGDQDQHDPAGCGDPSCDC